MACWLHKQQKQQLTLVQVLSQVLCCQISQQSCHNLSSAVPRLNLDSQWQSGAHSVVTSLATTCASSEVHLGFENIAMYQGRYVIRVISPVTAVSAADGCRAGYLGWLSLPDRKVQLDSPTADKVSLPQETLVPAAVHWQPCAVYTLHCTRHCHAHSTCTTCCVVSIC